MDIYNTENNWDTINKCRKCGCRPRWLMRSLADKVIPWIHSQLSSSLKPGLIKKFTTDKFFTLKEQLSNFLEEGWGTNSIYQPNTLDWYTSVLRIVWFYHIRGLLEPNFTEIHSPWLKKILNSILLYSRMLNSINGRNTNKIKFGF